MPTQPSSLVLLHEHEMGYKSQWNFTIVQAKVSGSSSEKAPETVEEATEATPVTTQPHQDENPST